MHNIIIQRVKIEGREYYEVVALGREKNTYGDIFSKWRDREYYKQKLLNQLNRKI